MEIIENTKKPFTCHPFLQTYTEGWGGKRFYMITFLKRKKEDTEASSFLKYTHALKYGWPKPILVLPPG